MSPGVRTALGNTAALAYPLGMFGLLNVNKPSGPTSHDIVAGVRKLIGRRKVKVGHAGTLDPFASGVLVICIGPATRLADYVQRRPKRYLAGITLGAASDTDDVTGNITETPGARRPEIGEVRAAVAEFVGRIRQVPPAHSAVHVDGRRAYKLARAGKQFDLPARPVHIHEANVLRYEYPDLEIDVACGAGTYIRSLARDIGARLDTGGYCSRLTRTGVGTFLIDEAVDPSGLDLVRDLIPPITAVETLPRITVDRTGVERIAMGQAVRVAAEVDAPHSKESEVAVTDSAGELLAIAKLVRTADGDTVRPSKVFVRARTGEKDDDDD